ncbi:2-oxo acid dehydrogenase subunit E2 [Flavobacteriaceae bacterium]|jgi:pyruvate dehydrogenase E2 component (dihydrolipoamide acetyltransferase)|nr:2-oxo acid dehydrogenase subunit E2 [Flavobacteriaceae bacterium]MDA7727863.1 2-oxo acid dehydrogenase subunit E2 [Flavobacteriaceae bacterium]MDA7848838.1 2-oxo acid dehydrogenase subunit E2 [Flavobacteriaceae bacterium]
MAIIVNMPRLSDTMEEGTVASWLKKVGDKVEEGDILAEIETDKATMEFESFNEGTLLHIGVQEGETTMVDELLAIIGDEGEDISALLANPTAAVEEATPQETTEETTENVVEAVTETSSTDIPEGVIVVTMPRLSDTMEEGTVASWLKNVGDTVEEGDILAEIETDKATMEFESFNEGTLLYIGLQEGESANVDDLLAIIGPAGTDVSAVAANFSAGATAVEEATPQESQKATAPVIKETPKADAAPVATPVAVAPVSNTTGRLHISPLARKMADDKGIALNQLVGSGENGRIIKRDVENYTPAAVSTASTAKFVPTGQEDFEEIKNSQMRKTIAKRLGESKFTAPHYYLNVEFDMDNAMAFRAQYNTVPDTKISFNDIIVKACALALRQHPQVNSQWFADRMKLNNHVHVGVAVAVEDGLVVPVVRFANEQSLPQIGVSVRDFAGRARNKKLTPQEMDGSTFTVSNLGMFGIESFTSIINQPNSAILSVGAIVQKPVVKNGQIVVGNTIKLTLACDHRTVDGATGAQFLQTLKGYVENPVTMLV